MARKQRTRRTIRALPKRRSFKRSVSRATSNPLMKALYGGVYGVARGYVSGYVTELTSKFLGKSSELIDNVAMGTVSYFLAKSKNKTMREIGTAGLYIEGALAGNDVTAMLKGNKTTTSTSSNSIR